MKRVAFGTAGVVAVGAMLLFGLTNPVFAENEQITEQIGESEGESGQATPEALEEQSDPVPGSADVEPEVSSSLGDVAAGSPGSLPAQHAVVPMSEGAWVEQPNSRLAGSDRYQTAARVAQYGYPNGAHTVILVTGTDFPDALSAAALGAKLQAPLLLTQRNVLPAVTSTELKRLNPQQVIIVGGTGVVSQSVENTIKAGYSEVIRLSGADRYATSVAIATHGWSSAKTVFVATGAGFADALSAAAAAGELDAPVILVPGNKGAVPANTIQSLNRLGTTSVRVAGGAGAVPEKMLSSLTSPSRAALRYGGSDRYETSALIAAGVFTNQRDTYFATGDDFADALTGAALAGAQGAPLFLVKTGCIPSQVYAANDRVTSGRSHLLGGVGVLNHDVLIGTECMTRPAGSTNADWNGMKKLYSALNQARFDHGLAAFRVADTAYGNPAYRWSRAIGTGTVKVDDALSRNASWAAYQTVAQTAVAGDKTTRLGELLLSNGEARSWLLKPTSGVRGSFSVGYAASGTKATATVIVGSNLK